MRICYIADAADVHTQRWAGYFAREGHEVHIISFAAPLESLDKVQIHMLGTLWEKNKILKHTINPLFVLSQLNRLIKKIDPELLHAHSVRDHTIIASMAGFHPFVVTAWGSDVLIHPKESTILKYAVPFALRRADLITCDGANTKNAMMEMGIKADKIEIIMHGVDTRKFSKSDRDEELQRELDIINSPTIISTRRLGRVHDVGTLINAIPLVLEEVPDAKFIIIGNGEQKDELIRLSKNLGVYGATRFLGPVLNDDLPRYLSLSDVYISISLSDSFAVSTLEAMACEIAPVVTDIGDNRRWIKDGENGFVIPTKDPRILSKRIIYLLENENVRQNFANFNRKIIEENADYCKEMNKVSNLYKELVRRRVS